MVWKRGLDQTAAWILATVGSGAVLAAGYGLTRLGEGVADGPSGPTSPAAADAEVADGHRTETPGGAPVTPVGAAAEAAGEPSGGRPPRPAAAAGPAGERSAPPAGKAGAAPPGWDYKGSTGPEHWGDLAEAYRTCARGKRQSPVDIDAPATNAKLLPLKFHYKPSELTLRNAGHAFQVEVPAGNFVEIDGDRYDLERLEFHTPSEHKVAGIPYDLELQLVHRDGAGHVVIVAVLFEEGAENKALAALWRELPAVGEAAPEAISLDPAALLPARRLYYTYPGSLTTPPCTEGVRWYVLSLPASVNAKQVDAVAGVIPFNARPTRALAGRKVVKSPR